MRSRLVSAALLFVVALAAPGNAAAKHQDFAAAASAASVDGRVFMKVAELRRHVRRTGRSWEPFLDRRPKVVGAYHLRPVMWRSRTYYSADGLARALRARGRSFARWARRHPVAVVRLRRNASARLPRPQSPAQPPAVAPAALALGIALENPEYAAPAALDRILGEIAATGSRWIRFDVKWADVQWHGPGSYQWARYDHLVDAARAHGLQVLANLAYSPSWARPAGASDKFAPDTAERRDAFARFAAAAATRYRDRVSAWEIWNEPNNPIFWQPLPNPASYAALLRAAYPALKAASPAATAIAGATAPAPTSGGLIDEVEFLQRVYAAGAAGYFDAWSHHPYDFNLAPGSPHKDSAWWQTYGTSPSIRSLMEAHGDGAKKVWATEYGVPSAGYGRLSEAVQAAWLGEAYAQWRAKPWGGPVFNYMLRDGVAPRVSSFWYYIGVVRDDWTRKPAFAVMQQAARP
jgi:hypothetical protein